MGRRAVARTSAFAMMLVLGAACAGDSNHTLVLPGGAVVQDAPAPASTGQADFTIGVRTVRSTTPRAAMTRLAQAWNRGDNLAVTLLTAPGIRPQLDHLRTFAVNLR